MSNTIKQTKNYSTNKIDIDPQTMVEFMDRCMDVQRKRRESVVGQRPKCQGCDSPGLSAPCTCQSMLIQAKWKYVKVETKIKTKR